MLRDDLDQVGEAEVGEDFRLLPGSSIALVTARHFWNWRRFA
jgi:hypothetical protein